MRDVQIQPIISNATNHSGQLVMIGNNVSGENHVVKLNPAKIAGIEISVFFPIMYVTHTLRNNAI